MTTAARDYDFRVLALRDIDPPPIVMRESMDDVKLGELVTSIRDKGVVSPIGVYENEGRFTIIYGHRRFVAAERAGELSLPARVHADGTAREEDYKFTENYYREEVNPAEEATYFADVLDRKFDGDILGMCAHFGLTESFVQGRLDLLRGDDDVLAALKAKKISLGVARELNKMKDAGYRRLRLADAMEIGASITTVQSWRIQDQRTLDANANLAHGAAGNVAPSTESPLTNVDVCPFCDLDDDQHDMEFVRVHRSCHQIQRRRLRAARTQQ